MDSSPLVKAHDHARAAAVATRQASDTTVAINEHTLAAGEFANAARNTSSLEALRTLKLLEEHHRKLAEILKLPPGHTATAADADLDEKQEQQLGSDPAADGRHDSADVSAAAAAAAAAATAAASNKSALPTLAQRYATREMTSSIASNLASARGIRSRYRGQPLSPSVSNDQAPGNVEPHPRRDGPKATMQNIIEGQSARPAWVPPPIPRHDADPARGAPALTLKTSADPESPPPPATAAAPAKDDGGYARFYSTFGSLINKISAPLAFAGLPLIQEEPPTPTEPADAPSLSPTARHHRVRIAPAPSAEPDLSKIYSRATLRALARDGHVPTDSFYVVPSTGHTMSYANILSYAEKEKRRLEASVHGDFLGGGGGGASRHENDDDDDFVDARENPASGARRRIARSHSDRELHNIVEELSTENKSLKDMLDKLTRRLHTFEASAQSMALAESYRIMRPASPLPSGAGGGGSSSSSRAHDDLAKKNTDLEEQVTALLKQMERLEKDNRKMQKTLEKYREKWETLKAGAKARREAQVTAESIEDTRSTAS